MIMEWIASILAFGYGALSAFAGAIQFRERSIPIWSASGMIIVGTMIMMCSVFTHFISKLLLLLILCLICMYILSIVNGIHLNGKVNIKHHVIRIVISFVIILLYIV